MNPFRRAVVCRVRRRRIAGGSGTSVQEVNALLRQFRQMRKMMKKMGRRKDLAAMFQPGKL